MKGSVQDLKIIFLGTPDFAVASLKALVDHGCQIVAVITAPDKPAGRGRQLQQSPVKQYALAQGLKLLQPERLKQKDFLAELKRLEADLQVVVAFRMLPESVWNMPPMGTINVHASLLPQYRGAAPINWAIINGEEVTGVTTFKLKHEIDTGDVLMQHEVAIADKDNFGTLYAKLMVAGADLLLHTLEQLAAGNIQEKAQQSVAIDTLKPAPKIFKEDAKIDWHQPVEVVHNLIRGLAPIPAAFTYLDEKQLKLYEADMIQEKIAQLPGTYQTDGKTYLKFAAADGWISCKDIQFEGKKRMDIASFLRGYRPQQTLY